MMIDIKIIANTKKNTPFDIISLIMKVEDNNIIT